MQGTLDYACAVYAVINALSAVHNLDLAGGRRILAETLYDLSLHPCLWRAFLHNETDHYWLIDYCLARWCRQGKWRLRAMRPFAPDPDHWDNLDDSKPPLFRIDGPGDNLHDPRPRGAEADGTVDRIFQVLNEHLGPETGQTRAALLRFLRFIPGSPLPIVLHWTTAIQVVDNSIFLHDSSSEPGALHVLERGLLTAKFGSANLFIEPESITLLER